jgi:hypothetical protein
MTVRDSYLVHNGKRSVSILVKGCDGGSVYASGGEAGKVLGTVVTLDVYGRGRAGVVLLWKERKKRESHWRGKWIYIPSSGMGGGVT